MKGESHQKWGWVMLIDQTVELEDVLEDEGGGPITVEVKVSTEKGDGGVLVSLPNESYRVVVENYGGKLICHVWATVASIGDDPTHSIEMELK